MFYFCCYKYLLLLLVCLHPGGSSVSYPSRQHSSGSAYRRQFPLGELLDSVAVFRNSNSIDTPRCECLSMSLVPHLQHHSQRTTFRPLCPRTDALNLVVCLRYAGGGGSAESYPSRQGSSGSASRRQFPSSATLFTGEPLRGVSASSFDLQEPTATAVSAAVTGRFNTYSPGELLLGSALF